MKKFCFGDGRCIKKNSQSQYYGGFYKPFKCSYNCKLVKCYSCGNNPMPKWMLVERGGKCSGCLKIHHNTKMMQKVFGDCAISEAC